MSQKTSLFLLHGWSGSAAFWNPLAQELEKLDGDIQIHAPNLPGHAGEIAPAYLGISDARDLAEWAAEWIRPRLRETDRVVVGGYSMGGRIATFLPEILGGSLWGTLLFSSGIGIPEAEVDARLDLERSWEEALLADAQKFWIDWYKPPLFLGIDEAELARLQESKKQHDISGLVGAMRAASLARHGCLEPQFRAMKHLLYFAGELDKKYSEIAGKVQKWNPAARVVIAPGADHIVPRRSPKFCAEVIRNWLKETK